MPTEITIDSGTGVPSGGGGFGGILDWANPIGAVASGLIGAFSARRQEKFQERMASTQYQRAAKDLEAAGLNRILALGSPAASAGGAGFSMPNVGEAIQSGQIAKQSISASKAAEALTQETEKGAKQTRSFNNALLMEQWRQAQSQTRTAAANATAAEAEASKQSKLKSFYDSLTPEEAAMIEAANSIGGASAALVPAGKAALNVLRGSTNSAKAVNRVDRTLIPSAKRARIIDKLDRDDSQ